MIAIPLIHKAITPDGKLPKKKRKSKRTLSQSTHKGKKANQSNDTSLQVNIAPPLNASGEATKGVG